MTPEDYVSYPLALALKKHGFDWECDHYYCAFDNEADVRFWSVHPAQSQNGLHTPKDTLVADAPTLAQAQKWLREKEGLYAYPEINALKKWFARAVDMKRNEDLLFDGTMFDTYEEAQGYAVGYALQLLDNEKE